MKLLLSSAAAIFSFSIFQTTAQTVLPKKVQHEVQATGKFDGTKAILRWAPSNYFRFETGTKTGYKIFRTELDSTQKEFHPELLTQAPLIPAPIETFKQLVASGDTLSAVAANYLYGQKVNQPLKKFDLEAAKKQNQEAELSYALCLLAADWDSKIADALALRYEDKTAVAGKIYLYTVIAIGVDGQLKNDTSGAIVSTLRTTPSPLMPQIFSNADDQSITLYWFFEETREKFSGYFIERSDDLGKTFHRTSKLPQVFMKSHNMEDTIFAGLEYFTDSVPQNYFPYQYRVIGLDPFGGTSQPGEIITAHSVDLMPPPPVTEIKLKQTGVRSVDISWDAPASLSSDFAGYDIETSRNIDGPYWQMNKKMLPPTVRTFTDTAVVGSEKVFYRIITSDTSHNSSASMASYLFYKDEVPPASVTNLTGVIDTLGRVTIHWKKPADLDIMGYTVERANDPTHAFSPVTTGFLSDTTFYDSITLNTLSRKIYYRVIAFDLTKNGSKPTAPLELIKPDKVAPQPPVIAHFLVTDSSVRLSWVPSPSTDVKEVRVWRKENDSSSRLIKTLAASDTLLIDHAVKAKSRYEYTLEAVDFSNLKSEKSFPLTVRVYQSSTAAAVKNLKAELNPESKHMLLSWSGGEAGASFIIYRELNSGGFELYGSAAAGQTSFEDAKCGKPGTYRYAVKSKTNDGRESELVEVSAEVK